jgi:hypothetical protein
LQSFGAEGDPKVLWVMSRRRARHEPELDAPERAMEWYNSPRYQAALQFTLQSAKTKMLILTGHSEG